MYKLTLADDTELHAGLCGSYDDGPLYLEIFEASFVECAQLFGDPTKTQTMVYDYTVGRATFEGYTELVGLRMENGVMNVTLRRPT